MNRGRIGQERLDRTIEWMPNFRTHKVHPQYSRRSRGASCQMQRRLSSQRTSALMHIPKIAKNQNSATAVQKNAHEPSNQNALSHKRVSSSLPIQKYRNQSKPLNQPPTRKEERSAQSDRAQLPQNRPQNAPPDTVRSRSRRQWRRIAWTHSRSRRSGSKTLCSSPSR